MIANSCLRIYRQRPLARPRAGHPRLAHSALFARCPARRRGWPGHGRPRGYPVVSWKTLRESGVDNFRHRQRYKTIMAEQPLTSDRETAAAPSASSARLWGAETLVTLAVLAAAGVIVVVFATQWDRWVGLAVRQVTDDAYVRGDITPLSAKVEGSVRHVAVDDFPRVKQGDLLV